MSKRPVEVVSIGNSDRGKFKNTVVLHDHDSGPYRLNRFPYPVIVSVNIDGKQPNVSRKAGLAEQSVDVFSGNPRRFRLQSVLPVNAILADPIDVGAATVQNHSLPVVVDHQESGVAFLVVLYAKLDESFMFDGDLVNQVLNDA